MIVDASAILAILKGEAEASTFLAALSEASARRLSAATYVEVSIVVDNSHEAFIVQDYERLLQEYGFIVEPVTEAQTRIARHAFREFGRGSATPAQLNFGDCFSYALAMERNEPLLYKGSDFAHTDVRSAIDEQ